MDKIKIGLAGVGMAWERLHAPAFERLSDKYEIVAVCDKDKNKAQAAARVLNLADSRVFVDCGQMFKDSDMEAADLMVPIEENFEIAKLAIENGIHIIAEKPFAATAEGAKDLIKLGAKKNVKILVAENYRYDEGNMLIAKIIEEKRIGNVAYFIDNHITEFQKEMLEDSFASAEWRQHPSFKGGVFLDTAVHHIAKYRFLFGDVLNIYAAGRPTDVDFSPYSCINAIMTFKDHITGLYAFFMIAKETQAPLTGFRIFGTNGEIYLEEPDCGFVNVSYKSGICEAIPYKPGEGYLHELENFYSAIRTGEEIVSTPEKELGDIQVVFNILESIEKEKVVRASNDYKRGGVKS